MRRNSTLRKEPLTRPFYTENSSLKQELQNLAGFTVPFEETRFYKEATAKARAEGRNEVRVGMFEILRERRDSGVISEADQRKYEGKSKARESSKTKAPLDESLFSSVCDRG